MSRILIAKKVTLKKSSETEFLHFYSDAAIYVLDTEH